MSPKEPAPIFLPRRYLLAIRISVRVEEAEAVVGGGRAGELEAILFVIDGDGSGAVVVEENWLFGGRVRRSS